MRRIIILVGLLFVATTVVVGLRNRQVVGLLLKCHTFTVDSACYTNVVEQRLHDNPDSAADAMKQIATLRRLGLLGGDFRAYSFMLHHLGSVYYENNTSYEMLARKCPALVKDGCVHGFVMEYYSVNGEAKTQELCRSSTQFRLRAGCLHAYGHSYAEHTAKSLVDIRDECIRLSSDDTYIACFSGMLHEHIRGGANSNNHDMYYAKPASFGNLDCAAFGPDTLEYSLCYAAIGSFRQYDQHAETAKDTNSICRTAENNYAEQICIQMINERIAIAHGYAFIPR